MIILVIMMMMIMIKDIERYMDSILSLTFWAVRLLACFNP